MAHHHPRIPALLILAASLALGGFVAGPQRQAASAGDDAELDRLQVAIAQGDAGVEVWHQYGQQLQHRRRFAHAAAAYQRALQLEPYHRQARLGAACALAQAGDADEFALFMRDVVLVDPKLTVDIFERPETQRYLSERRFETLAREARIQSMD